jgi:hypothetical protein
VTKKKRFIGLTPGGGGVVSVVVVVAVVAVVAVAAVVAFVLCLVVLLSGSGSSSSSSASASALDLFGTVGQVALFGWELARTIFEATDGARNYRTK